MTTFKKAVAIVVTVCLLATISLYEGFNYYPSIMFVANKYRQPSYLAAKLSTLRKTNESLKTQFFRINQTLYAAISGSTPSNNQYNYVFDLPLTILSWQRIGFNVIITIAGTEKEWEENSILNLILQYVYSFGVTLLFIDCPSNNRVTISQVSRLLVSSLVKESMKPTDYIVLSDADLWPLNRTILQPSRKFAITSLNSECCGYFEHLGKRYKMLPMAHVGTTVATWLDMIQTNRFLPRDGDTMLKYLEAEFGSVARKPVKKGMNIGWFQDQRMLSILVEEWIQRNNRSRVNFVKRNCNEDRIDRGRWKVDSLEGKIDSHVLVKLYKYDNWIRIIPLLQFMYGKDSEAFRFCVNYYNEFTKVLFSEKG